MEHLGQELNRQKEKNKALQERYVALCLENIRKNADPEENIFLFEEELDPGARRDFVNKGMEMTRGLAGVFVGTDDSGYSMSCGAEDQTYRRLGKSSTPVFRKGRRQASYDTGILKRK